MQLFSEIAEFLNNMASQVQDRMVLRININVENMNPSNAQLDVKTQP